MTDIHSTTVPSFERLPNGLVKGVTYHRRPSDGRILWDRMIDPKHIVFNSKLDTKLTDIYGAPANKLSYADLIAEGKEVDPKHLLVLLQGFIEVIALRGGSATPRIAHVCSYPLEAAICSCECTIDWIANEEEPNGFRSYGTADATMENTGGWGYLSAMAGNRALVRAARQGLRIPIMSFDEIAKKDTPVPEAASTSAQLPMHASTLQRAAEAKKLTFDQVKQGALTTYRADMESDPTSWTKWEDVPPRDCLKLIKIIKAPKK